MAQTTERIYEDFEPVSDILSEEECDTLLLYLPGFKKEQLKVQLSALRILRVFGERPMGDNKWRRFHREFNVPSNIDLKGITAKFEGGILYIRQPKLIAPEQDDQGKAAAEAPAPELQQDGSSEEKTEKKDEREEDVTEKREKDEISEEKNEERKEKSELDKTFAARAGRSSGLFKELRKPEKLGKMVVYVILLLILAFHIIKTLKFSRKFEQQSVLEYDHQEL